MTSILSPIKTGICSFGMSGQVFHAPFLDCLEEFEFSAVTERHHRNAEKRYPSVKTYTSVDDMVKDKELELIVVNTPNTLHYEHAKTALQAGKNVLIEKPFAATSQQAKELMDLANRQKKLLLVYQNRRWDSDFQAVKQVIESGRLGKLIDAEFHYDRYRVEKSVKAHKEFHQTGVGLIYDLGPHLIDQALALFGKPKAVFARVQKHRPNSQVDDYFMINLLYPDFNCVLKSSLLVKEQGPGYILHGSEGSFIKDRADVQEAALQNGLSPCSDNWGKEPVEAWGLLHLGDETKERLESPRGSYQKFYQGVYACLRKGAPSPVKATVSLLNMKIIEAALASEDQKQVISLD